MTLCLLGTVLNQCSEPIWQNDEGIHLTVKPDASVSFEDLRKLGDHQIYVSQIEDSDKYSQFAKGESGDLPAGASFTFTVPRRVNDTVVARNLADLISIDTATQQTPLAYFLIQDEETKTPFCYIGSITDGSKNVRRYHDAIRLWKCLVKNAEYTTAPGSLFFFGVRRTEIRSGFAMNDLAQNIEAEEVENFLNNEERPEARAEIFRSVLSEFLRDQLPEKAFSYMLRSSGSFAQRLSEGWKIYLLDYSPAKLNEQAITKHLELTEKLEKIIGGMEAKSLTIPAAVLLAVKEVQFGAQWTTLNTIILASSLLYLLAMTVAHFSQRSTLILLKTTITKTTSDLQAQGLERDNLVLKDSFANLGSRRKNSLRGSWAMFIFSFVPLVAVIYAAFWAPPPPPKLTTRTGHFITTAIASIGNDYWLYSHTTN